MIDKWPSAGAVVNRSRVPSCIAYADENRYIRTTKWGFQVKSSHVAAAWAKLHLETGVIDRVTEDNDDGWADTVGIFRQPGGRDPIHIAKDFLESVREHIEPQIKLACKYASLTVLPLFYVFIVPATWSEGVVEKTREAAYLANFSRKQRGKYPLFVTEPESALTALLANGNIQTEVCTQWCYVIPFFEGCGYFRDSPERRDWGLPEDRRAHSDMIPDIEDLKLTDTSPASEMMQHFEKAKCDFTGDTSSGPTYLPYTMDVVAEGAALWAYNRLRSRIALHHHYGLESSGTENDAMFWLFKKVPEVSAGYFATSQKSCSPKAQDTARLSVCKCSSPLSETGYISKQKPLAILSEKHVFTITPDRFRVGGIKKKERGTRKKENKKGNGAPSVFLFCSFRDSSLFRGISPPT
ncbi:hypothetical protein ASPNIDRAFT_42025, partial [Aspergillus niger ATCC 1015]